jgi:hypothetical protein
MRDEKTYFSLITLNPIFDFLGCVTVEMVCLALHGAETGLHPG